MPSVMAWNPIWMDSVADGGLHHASASGTPEVDNAAGDLDTQAQVSSCLWLPMAVPVTGTSSQPGALLAASDRPLSKFKAGVSFQTKTLVTQAALRHCQCMPAGAGILLVHSPRVEPLVACYG